MVTSTLDRPRTAVDDRPPPARRARRSPWRLLRENVIWIFATLALIFMLLPNVVVVIFSFNKPNGRFNYTWTKFSFNAWEHPCAAPGMCDSLKLSLGIGLSATLVATILGTLIAFGLGRYRFRGRAASNLLVFLPMATPEVVMGSSLLSLFVSIGWSLNAKTIFIAHVMFCLSYVVVTVKARIAGLDPRLEQAASDLYANEVQTFTRVTLPLVAPGIASGALLAFSLSFDDYIVSSFNAGSRVTFPMYIYGAAQRGVPVQVNVIGTWMFLIAIIGVGVAQVVASRRNKFRW
jgi:spermidine/putrescine transport system permease protein